MNLLALPLMLPVALALLGVALRNHARGRQITGLLTAIGIPAAAFLVLMETLGGDIAHLAVGSWHAPFGIILVADLTAALFLFTAAVTASLVFFHALLNPMRGALEKWFFPLANFVMLGVNGSLLTGDLFNLFVWFEVMLIGSFVMLILGGKRAQLEGGLKYVVINLVGSGFFLGGVAMIYGITGTLNFADIAVKIQLLDQPAYANSGILLLFGAFAIKAGLFPFFFWLPAAYHTPPAVITAFFGGLLSKVGIYAFFRTSTLFLADGFGPWQNLMLWAAALTMITGVLGAAAHFHMRRILAFHIISQIGYLMAGVAMFTAAGLAAGLFYFIHNNVAKTNLLLISAVVERKCGTSRLERIGGLYKSAPWLSIWFLISALALAGIPPLSGFWAKLGIVRAGIEGGYNWLVFAALGVGMMTLFSMTKLWAEAFWKKQPEHGGWEDEEERGPTTRLGLAPVVAMVAIILALSFAGGAVFDVCNAAASQLLDPTQYIRAILGEEGTP